MAMAASLFVSLGSVWVGRRLAKEARRADRSLSQALDEWTRDSEEGQSEEAAGETERSEGAVGETGAGHLATHPQGTSSAELSGAPPADGPSSLPLRSGFSNWLFSPADAQDTRDTVARIFSCRTRAEVTGWVLELSSCSKSLSARLAGATRGLVRIPFLAATAAALAMIALERLDQAALTRAGLCLSLGLTSSFVNQLVLRGARRSLRGFRDGVDALVRQSATLRDADEGPTGG